MTLSSGGEAIVSGLVAHGVDTVFGLPGPGTTLNTPGLPVDRA